MQNDMPPQSSPAPPEWSWEHPRDFWLGLATCEKLERMLMATPFTRGDLQDLGLAGLQFGSWKSPLRSCLNTDIVGLRSGEASTDKGHIFLVDGESYFIELDARDRPPPDNEIAIAALAPRNTIWRPSARPSGYFGRTNAPLCASG